ncbi:hypothetical protein MCUN1_003557 [Malassezia cuniculi]|uniref:Vacuolar protein 14 C-terminal Fig4-binding domain-containing protein n=1 Tax=Malassezia cuniculi TaxID=948313 RepID=A0AAF0ETU1_9BASI|nr:hypothetical protein MCUN1_003557 [Malassezia cuniculi]
MVSLIVQQLCQLLVEKQSQQPNARNGGLIGLAGVAIALGQEVATFLDRIVPPLLACFSDPDAKTRYFTCESFYNIAKVCKGEVLVYFNEIFDVLSRLAADSELSVKNGAELLDRLLKDIVCEAAPHYVSIYQDVARIRARQDAEFGATGGVSELDVAREKAEHEQHVSELHVIHDERDMAMNKAFSLARFVPLLAQHMQAVSPLTRNYLVGWVALLDSVPDLQIVAYLPSFLRALFRYLSDPNPDVRVATSEVLSEFIGEIRDAGHHKTDEDGGDSAALVPLHAGPEEDNESDSSASHVSEELVHVPGHVVRIQYDAILEILLEQSASSDEDVQATTLRWITEFLQVVTQMVVPFTPRLIAAVLPSLAHPSPAIQGSATETNAQLFAAVQRLRDDAPSSATTPSTISTPDPIGSIPLSLLDIPATVAELQTQLKSEHDETRLSALEWLIMLHQKAPQIFATSGFDAFLNALSDPSEEVILADLRLLAQISSVSDDAFVRTLLSDLLQVFRTESRLLETRGTLIVRQLCASLQTEKVFCTMAEILEREEDLEFASTMVQHLTMVLLTSPELAAFRRRLRTLDARDSQQLFVALYRSWCHSAVSAICLCLLAQAYEHACSLLRTMADLEITLSMLIQLDKLVQLLESPIFTPLRLQLLEPDANPYLFKCLYGILMLLPQSSAFATLRNRLNAVNGLGYLQAVGRTSYGGTTQTPRKIGAGEIKWPELQTHFRQVQLRHERARRHAPASESPGALAPPLASTPAISRVRRRDAPSIHRMSTNLSGISLGGAPSVAGSNVMAYDGNTTQQRNGIWGWVQPGQRTSSLSRQ